MNSHEYDEIFENLEDITPKRSKRTKFRDFNDKDDTTAKRDKRSSRRSHRQQTNKDGLWPDNDDQANDTTFIPALDSGLSCQDILNLFVIFIKLF